jgi:hypothetical protein
VQAEGGCPGSGRNCGHGPHFPNQLAKIPVNVHMDSLNGGCDEREHSLRVALNIKVAIIQAHALQPWEELGLVYLPHAEDVLVYHDLPWGHGRAQDPQADDAAGACKEPASPQRFADVDASRIC